MDFIEDYKAYKERLSASLNRISELDLARKRLTYTRWKVAENLDKLLFEFETNVRKGGAGITWCPDVKTSMENLDRQLKNFHRVVFFQHTAVRHFVNELDLKVSHKMEDPDAVVLGAKFIMANTGNFYCALNSLEEFEQVLSAKKIIVIAGVDSLLSSQSELPLARQLYGTFETGNLSYSAEFMGRPGRARGINGEIVLFLTDLYHTELLEIPAHRPLFSLLNFDLPPVCPLQQLEYDPESWKKMDTLAHVLYAFMHGIESHASSINGNYGLGILNQYLPYDIDLYQQILDARALLHKDDKKSKLMALLDPDKSAIVFNTKKFKEPEKFRKYAEHNFFGKMPS